MAQNLYNPYAPEDEDEQTKEKAAKEKENNGAVTGTEQKEGTQTVTTPVQTTTVKKETPVQTTTGTAGQQTTVATPQQQTQKVGFLQRMKQRRADRQKAATKNMDDFANANRNRMANQFKPLDQTGTPVTPVTETKVTTPAKSGTTAAGTQTTAGGTQTTGGATATNTAVGFNYGYADGTPMKTKTIDGRVLKKGTVYRLKFDNREVPYTLVGENVTTGEYAFQSADGKTITVHPENVMKGQGDEAVPEEPVQTETGKPKQPATWKVSGGNDLQWNTLEEGKEYMFGMGDGGYKKYKYVQPIGDDRLLVEDENGKRYYIDKTYKVYDEGYEPHDYEAESGYTEGEADDGSNVVPSYLDLFKESRKNPTLSDAELKKQQRRERAEKALAGLGDIGASLANLWTTAKGATPWTLDSKDTLSGVYKDKWDTWRKDYQDRIKDYQTAYDKAAQYDATYKLKSRDQVRKERQLEMQTIKNQAEIAIKQLNSQLKAEELKLKGPKNEAEIAQINENIKRIKQQTALYKNMTEHPEKYHPVHQTNINYSGSHGYSYNGRTYKTPLEAWNHVPDRLQQKALDKMKEDNKVYRDDALKDDHYIGMMLGWIEDGTIK